MGWTHIPDMDTHSSSAEDNLFAAPKQQPVVKVSVFLPTDNWLCRKMDGLNLTFTQDIHPGVQKQGICRGTSLLSTVNHRRSGTG